jgi:hypothetical protein
MRSFTLLSSLLLLEARTSVAQPPCHTPLNPALETICYATLVSDGNFSVRTYAKGLNVSLVSATSANYGNWKTDSTEATEL